MSENADLQKGQAATIDNSSSKQLFGLSYAKATNVGAQSIPSATPTLYNFDTVQTTVFPPRLTGMISVSAPDRITFRENGFYLILARFSWAANAVGVRTIEILSNTFATEIASQNANSAGGTDHIVQTMQPYFAGDFVQFRVTQTSGAPLNLNPGCEIYALELAAR